MGLSSNGGFRNAETPIVVERLLAIVVVDVIDLSQICKANKSLWPVIEGTLRVSCCKTIAPPLILVLANAFSGVHRTVPLNDIPETKSPGKIEITHSFRSACA